MQVSMIYFPLNHSNFMLQHHHYYQQDLQEEMLMEKVVWRCIIIISGGQCVMISGIYLMPLWCVLNSALLVLLEPQRIHSLKEVINPNTTVSIIMHLILPCTVAEQSVPIHFNEAQCTGVELDLGECRFNTNHTCDHREDAGVICIGKKSTVYSMWCYHAKSLISYWSTGC